MRHAWRQAPKRIQGARRIDALALWKSGLRGLLSSTDALTGAGVSSTARRDSINLDRRRRSFAGSVVHASSTRPAGRPLRAKRLDVPDGQLDWTSAEAKGSQRASTRTARRANADTPSAARDPKPGGLREGIVEEGRGFSCGPTRSGVIPRSSPALHNRGALGLSFVGLRFAGPDQAARRPEIRRTDNHGVVPVSLRRESAWEAGIRRLWTLRARYPPVTLSCRSCGCRHPSTSSG